MGGHQHPETSCACSGGRVHTGLCLEALWTVCVSRTDPGCVRDHLALQDKGGQLLQFLHWLGLVVCGPDHPSLLCTCT